MIGPLKDLERKFYISNTQNITTQNNYQGLSLVCGFDLRFNKSFENKILLLVSSINSRLWLGHFDIWFNEGLVLYRNTSFFEKNKTSYKDKNYKKNF